MHAVFHLDQTLVRGEDADWRAWLAAIEDALDVPVPLDQDWTSYPVHTDHALFAEVAMRFRGRPHTASEWNAFARNWSARVNDILDVYAPIPGAREFLAMLPNAAIATGNLHSVTLRKLASAGFGALPCACSGDAPDRPSLVGRALAQTGWRVGIPAVSFGDGIWDVRAARALGVGFVGVAQSDAHEARLRAEGVRHVLRDFQDRDAVLAVAGEAARRGLA